MPIICLLGLLLLLLLLLLLGLETLSILVIGSWIHHARSTGARILNSFSLPKLSLLLYARGG